MGWNRKGPVGHRAWAKTHRIVSIKPTHLCWTSPVQHHGHGLLVMGHVVGQEVGHGESS